jgi:hypothetical protein
MRLGVSELVPFSIKYTVLTNLGGRGFGEVFEGRRNGRRDLEGCRIDNILYCSTILIYLTLCLYI